MMSASSNRMFGKNTKRLADSKNGAGDKLHLAALLKKDDKNSENGYYRRKQKRQPKFKSWTRLFAFYKL